MGTAISTTQSINKIIDNSDGMIGNKTFWLVIVVASSIVFLLICFIVYLTLRVNKKDKNDLNVNNIVQQQQSDKMKMNALDASNDDVLELVNQNGTGQVNIVGHVPITQVTEQDDDGNKGTTTGIQMKDDAIDACDDDDDLYNNDH